MEVTLKYKLPEEQNLLSEALKADKYAFSLYKIKEELDSLLREKDLTFREVNLAHLLYQLIPEGVK